MALNGTGIEFGKSEHDSRWRISRATTISADFIVLVQRCGQQVFLRKVGHDTRAPPVRDTPTPPAAVHALRVDPREITWWGLRGGLSRLGP